MVPVRRLYVSLLVVARRVGGDLLGRGPQSLCRSRSNLLIATDCDGRITFFEGAQKEAVLAEANLSGSIEGRVLLQEPPQLLPDL
jgi:hypothetical protein